MTSRYQWAPGGLGGGRGLVPCGEEEPPLLRPLALLIALLLPALAHAGVADDAALAAQEVTEEHCAQGATGPGAQRSQALVEVSKVLGRVDLAWEQTQEPYLLYWRGMIYQCLGQYEDALADFAAFLEEAAERSAYAEQRKAARSQLVRAGRKVAESALGPSARRVRLLGRLELRAQYGAGAAVRDRNCTESVDPEAITFQRCVGGGAEAGVVGASAVPLDAGLEAVGFALPEVGFGGGASATWALPHQDVVDGKDVSLDLSPTTPGVLGWLGPVFRALNPSSTARSVSVRVSPRLVFGAHRLEAQAGHYDFASVSQPEQQLGGGTWTALQLGGGVELALRAELGDRAVFSLEVDAAGFLPAPPQTLLADGPPDSGVEAPLEPLEANRVRAGAQVGVLVIPTPDGQVALGPSLGVQFEQSHLQLPDGLEHTWGRRECSDGSGDTCGEPHWKVFSTRRLGLVVRGGVQIEVLVR